jgi:uncharacterized protein
MKKFSLALCGVLTLSVLVGAVCAALAVPPPPPLDKPILDSADMLSESDEAALNQTMNDERLKTGHQLAVLTIPTLEGESLEEYSLKVARQWAVGDKDKDNGVLLLIAKNDRKLRIEVGSGLEGSLTDARASRIIRNVITPQFKQGDYFNGIRMGIAEIQSAIRGDAESATSHSSGGEEIRWGDVLGTVIFGLYFLLAIVSWIVSILARTKSWWAGGIFGGIIAVTIISIFGAVLATIIAGLGLVLLGVVFDYFISKNYKARKTSGRSPAWWAGGTTFGGGGSGGGGFSGGGFSGGGASGSW